MYQLGQLRVQLWVAEGEASRADYGFTETSDRVTIDLRTSDKPQTLILEFGKSSPNTLPYALTVVDGQTFVIELPPAVYLQIINILFKRFFQVLPKP